MSWISRFFQRSKQLPGVTLEVLPRASSKSSDFVAACFDEELRELPDDRVFGDFPEIQRSADSFRNDRFGEALDEARRTIEAHPDLFLGYLWAGNSLDALDRKAEALRTYLLGLKECPRKATFCHAIAEVLREEGRYLDATLWWIRSCRVQMESDSANNPQSFLSLGYLMAALGDREAQGELLDLAAGGAYGQIDLDAEGQRKQADAARGLGSVGAAAVRDAVDRLLST